MDRDFSVGAKKGCEDEGIRWEIGTFEIVLKTGFWILDCLGTKQGKLDFEVTGQNNQRSEVQVQEKLSGWWKREKKSKKIKRKTQE